MIGPQRRTQRATIITCRRLDVNVLERRVGQQFVVRHTVERDTARHHQVARVGTLMQRVRHVDQRFFGHHLNALGDVGVILVTLDFRLVGAARIAARGEEFVGMHAWLAKQIDKLLVQAVRCRVVVGEVIHVQVETAVAVERDQFLDLIDIGRVTVGRHPHDFVFAVVDAEAQERGKRGIEQAQRVREALFGEQVDLVRGPIAEAALGEATCSGGPFADPVNCHDCGFFER